MQQRCTQQEIERHLNAAEIRPTPARCLILSLLLEAGHPLSQARLAADPRAEGLDRVTIYRSFGTLLKAQLLHRVQGSDGAWRFCAHRIDEQRCPGGHPHFMCERCGLMICLPGALPWVQLPEGFSVKEKQLLLSGLCLDCQEPI